MYLDNSNLHNLFIYVQNEFSASFKLIRQSYSPLEAILLKSVLIYCLHPLIYFYVLWANKVGIWSFDDVLHIYMTFILNGIYHKYLLIVQ